MLGRRVNTTEVVGFPVRQTCMLSTFVEEHLSYWLVEPCYSTTDVTCVPQAVPAATSCWLHHSICQRLIRSGVSQRCRRHRISKREASLVRRLRMTFHRVTVTLELILSFKQFFILLMDLERIVIFESVLLDVDCNSIAVFGGHQWVKYWTLR